MEIGSIIPGTLILAWSAHQAKGFKMIRAESCLEIWLLLIVISHFLFAVIYLDLIATSWFVGDRTQVVVLILIQITHFYASYRLFQHIKIMLDQALKK